MWSIARLSVVAAMFLCACGTGTDDAPRTLSADVTQPVVLVAQTTASTTTTSQARVEQR